MLLPLITGMPVILCNMLLQSLVSIWCIRFYLKRFHSKEGLLAGVLALFGTIIIILMGNLLQILLWGVLLSGWASFRRCWMRCITPGLTSRHWGMAML